MIPIEEAGAEVDVEVVPTPLDAGDRDTQGLGVSLQERPDPFGHRLLPVRTGLLA